MHEVDKTVKALQYFSQQVSELEVDTLIIITPHGPMQRDSIALTEGNNFSGSFARFGAPDVKLEIQLDQDLIKKVMEEAEKADIPVKNLPAKEGQLSKGVELDHGAGVPLYYLREAGVRAKGLHITFGLLSPEKLYKFGQLLHQAAEQAGSRIAIIASGDLSHRLTPSAPAGYNPRGAEFDEKLVELISNYQVEKIMKMDPELVEEAGECGLRSIIIMLGALHGKEVTPEVLSYEGPFGVGYMVASFKLNSNPAENISKTNYSEREDGTIYPWLARKSIEEFLNKGRLLSITSELPEELTGRQQGAFVTLKKGGNLRGCIGTVEPVQANLAEEIINNAVGAASRDPRFPPLKPEEIEEVDISVDVLSPLEPVEDMSSLDPHKYGVVVRRGPQKGLLLPDLEGIDTVEKQLEIALQKAGISPRKSYEIYRFTVTRYPESGSNKGGC